MLGVLAVLTLLGLGWCCLRWRDPRFVLLALWFWVGFAGVIVTVETPNVQRMGAAVPVVALFPALVLDSLARRVEIAAARRQGSRFSPRTARILAWGLAGVVALYVMAADGSGQRRKLKIFRARVLTEDAGRPASVSTPNDSEVLVATGRGALRLEEVQLEGKRRMSAADFLRGFSSPTLDF